MRRPLRGQSEPREGEEGWLELSPRDGEYTPLPARPMAIVGLRPLVGSCYIPPPLFSVGFLLRILDKLGVGRSFGMQAYDILMLVVLGLAIVWGAWKGLAWQVASIASIGLSYFVALHFRLPLSNLINASPPWNIFVSMLILFLGT